MYIYACGGACLCIDCLSTCFNYCCGYWCFVLRDPPCLWKLLCLCYYTGGFHYDNHLFYVVCVHDGNRSTIAILECYRSHSRIQSVHMVPALGEANLDGVGTTIFATFLFPIFLNWGFVLSFTNILDIVYVYGYGSLYHTKGYTITIGESLSLSSNHRSISQGW